MPGGEGLPLRPSRGLGRPPSAGRGPATPREIGDARVLCGLSGGVDSSVAAVLLHEAIGDRLTCVFVDHGLLREGEADEVVRLFRDAYAIPLVHAQAQDLFIEASPASKTRRPSARPSAVSSSTSSTPRPRASRRTGEGPPPSSRRARSTRT